MRLRHSLIAVTTLLTILLMPTGAVAARRGDAASRPSQRSINTEARTGAMNEFVEQRQQERRDRSERLRRSGVGSGRLGTGKGILRLERSGRDRPSRRDINWRANPDRQPPQESTAP